MKLGQKIGDGEGVCSPVHASVSGTVAAVEQLPIPGGKKVRLRRHRQRRQGYARPRDKAPRQPQGPEPPRSWRP